MAGFSLDMAINRTNVGRQMVGDLGNFVGTDLRKQFMFGPQKLAYGPQKFAEGETVAEEITFETVSFTDDITGKTKTFKYNPETHHPPDSTGRMRKKGVNTSDVATQGGVNFFDTAELVEQPAAPAGPAAPPKAKQLDIPDPGETEAEREENLEAQSQLFRPLKHGYASAKDALTDYKISKYTDPAIRLLSRGAIDPDIDDRLRRYMGKKPDQSVRDTSSIVHNDPRYPTTRGQRIRDPRDQTLGLGKEIDLQTGKEIDIVDRELAGMRKLHGLGKDERFSDQQVKDLFAAGQANVFQLQKPSVAGGDPVDEAKKEGLSSLIERGERKDVTGVEGPEKGTGRSEEEYDKIIWDAFSDPVNKAIAKADKETVAEKIVTKKPPPKDTYKHPVNLNKGYFDEAGKWHPEEMSQEEKDVRSGKTTVDSIRKQLQEQGTLGPAERGLRKGLTNIDAGAGDVRPPESDWSRGFDGLTFGSEEAYLDTIQSEIMGRLDEEDRQQTFDSAAFALSRGNADLAGRIIAAGSEDQPDKPTEDWGYEEGTVDWGSPFRQGGPVRFARGGGLSSLNPPINPGDFVIASDVVSGIGDGSSQFGVERLTDELGVQPRPFSAALGGEVRGPGSGLDDLIQTSVRGKQAARLANQEFVVPRQDVMKIGKGNLKNGQEMLYALMDRVRKQKSGGQQPPRLQGSLAGLMGNMRS